MILNNSSSQRAYQHQNQTKNLATILNYNFSSPQFSHINDRSIPKPFLINHKLVVITLSFLILLLSILILVFILKFKRKKKKIQRQKAIHKRHNVPKSDIPHDLHTSLIQQNNSETTNNSNHIRSNDNINKIFLTTVVLEEKPTNISSEIRRNSSTSKSSEHRTTTNSVSETDDNDDFSHLDLKNIPLRHINPLKNNLPNSSLLSNPDPALNESSENPYIRAFKEREKEKADARKKVRDMNGSNPSTTSEESCV